MRDFFGKFGVVGVFLFAVSLIISAVTAYRIAQLKKITPQSNQDTVIFGTKHKLLLTISAIAKYAFMFCLVTFCTSCSGEVFFYATGISRQYGALLFAVISALISMTGKNGVLTVFSLCVPIISAFCIIYSVCYTFNIEKISTTKCCLSFNKLYSPILYASYNVFAGVGSFAITDNYDKHTLKKGLLTGSIILFFCGSAIMWSTVLSPWTNTNSLPMVDIIYRQSSILGCIFSILLFLSLISTSVSRIFMLGKQFNSKTAINKSIGFVICFSAYAACFVGIENIIGFIYPAFGIVGVFTVISANLRYIKNITFSNTKLSCAFLRRQKA